MIPDASVFAVILFVLLLVAVADRLPFRPLVRVMRVRETAIRSAQELARASAAQAEAALADAVVERVPGRKASRSDSDSP